MLVASLAILRQELIEPETLGNLIYRFFGEILNEATMCVSSTDACFYVKIMQVSVTESNINYTITVSKNDRTIIS